MIIKKHNHRKLHREYIEKKASTGFYTQTINYNLADKKKTMKKQNQKKK